MSEFSEKCKLYLTETETNVYQLSKTYGLDRTTLQRMITGKRLPGMDFIHKFCKCVRINAFQTRELIELYLIDKLGKTVYNNRKCIYNILDYLSFLEDAPATHHISLDSSVENDIFLTLKRCFQSNAPGTIYTNLTSSCIAFFNSLKRLQATYNTCIPVKHLFQLQSNPSVADNVNSNLESLYTILPITLSGYEDYQLYYYYSKLSSVDLKMALYPYYILTETEILLISPGLTDVLRLTDPSYVASYRRHFENVLQDSELLVRLTNDITQASIDYTRASKKNGSTLYALEPHPCVQAMLYSLELLDELSFPKFLDKDMVIHFLKQQHQQFRNNQTPFHNFFTLDGLDYFVETGNLCGHYEMLALHFTPKQRIKMLQNLLSGASESYHPHLLKSSFPCSRNMHLEVCRDLSLRIFYLDAKSNFYSLLLTESSIGSAMEDFFHSLQEANLLYSIETQHQIIKDRIEKLSKFS